MLHVQFGARRDQAQDLISRDDALQPPMLHHRKLIHILMSDRLECLRDRSIRVDAVQAFERAASHRRPASHP